MDMEALKNVPQWAWGLLVLFVVVAVFYLGVQQEWWENPLASEPMKVGRYSCPETYMPRKGDEEDN